MDKFEKYRKFDEPVHIVYGYFIDDLKSCYIGRTKSLRDRDLSHRRGRKHSDGSMTYDSIYTFCCNNSVSIPQPKILSETLTGIKSLEIEDYWVKYYRQNGWNVLNKAKTGLKSGSLGHIKIWDYETCKEECKKYKTRSELKENSFGCYEVCLNMGWIDEFMTVFGKHPNGFWKVKEDVIAEAKKYKNISDFAHKSNGAYISAKRNGWLGDLNFHKQENILDFNEVWDYYKSCNNINKTISKFRTSYKRLKNLFELNGKAINSR